MTKVTEVQDLNFPLLQHSFPHPASWCHFTEAQALQDPSNEKRDSDLSDHFTPDGILDIG